METIKVYSKIEDNNIKKSLNDSPIWKQAIHETELPAQEKGIHLFEYVIKFDGLVPIQVTSIKKIII